MNKELVSQLERRTGVLIPNKGTALDIINKWINSVPGSFNPYKHKPKDSTEKQLIDALKIECRKAADIVSKWDSSQITEKKIRRLFTIPELCRPIIEKLNLLRSESFCKYRVRNRYTKNLKSKRPTNPDPFLKETIRRHANREIRHPGEYKPVDSPYARAIEVVAEYIKSHPDEDEEDDSNDDGIGPIIDL